LLFREHPQLPDILSRAHRFRAIDRAGLFALAKDLARLTADSIDVGALHRLLSLPRGDRTGSLKCLEMLLASRTDPATARKSVAPLVGIYQLRLADAHLPTSELEASLQLVEIDSTLPMVQQGAATLARMRIESISHRRIHRPVVRDTYVKMAGP